MRRGTHDERERQIRSVDPGVVCPAGTRGAPARAAHVERHEIVARAEARVLELVHEPARVEEERVHPGGHPRVKFQQDSGQKKRRGRGGAYSTTMGFSESKSLTLPVRELVMYQRETRSSLDTKSM